ncbi:MAG: DUF3488 and transglutaminase-like domain-containing protein [Gammaproteobacteria bacterium]|nr:DUF3488 and transglutaminase-like domain-containing protein [Gammaproteobacteria bacterium]
MQNNLPIDRIAEETADRTSIVAVSLSFLVAMLPHFFNLPFWITGFTLFALMWRGAQSRGWLWAIPRWILVPLVLAGGISVFAEYWTIVGREPGLALLTVMTSFKFLESKTHRDILILVFLCYFLLATHFLFGQTLYIAAYMFGALIFITTTLITINQREENIALSERLKIASRLIGLSVPIMLILFLLVPRIPGPIWGITQEQRGGVTGLSETMSPGEISNLITSNEVAFRVTFDGTVPRQDQLYWRGPVMANFTGRTWLQHKHTELKNLNVGQTGQLVQYTITLEPNGKNWLFGLDIPTGIIEDSYMNNEYQLTSDKAVNDLKRYTLSSTLTYQLELEESLDYLLLTSEYPENSNPETLALGQRWAREYNSDTEIVNAALSMFRNQEYIYTLQPPVLGRHSSDEFLFSTRRGFCEHYASSFTLLMRAAGIPARIVTGYQGGEYNQVGNYLIVRQSDAHAWSEVWLEDQGWVRIDPTAAVSPDRIEIGLDQALNEGLSSFKIANRNPLIGKILYSWDNLQHSWNRWVLNYDQQKQMRFLSNLGLGIRTWGDMVIALVIGLVLITGSYWLISWYRDLPERPADYEIIINRLLKKLERSGYQRKPSEYLHEFLVRIEKEQGYQDEDLEKIFTVYNKIKYARGYQRENVIKRFRQLSQEWRLKQTT